MDEKESRKARDFSTNPMSAPAGIIGGGAGAGGVQGPAEAQSHHHAEAHPSRSSTPIFSTTNDSKPFRQTSRPGHEGFVQPASYLRRSRALSRPMPPQKQLETAIDREQRQGLVSHLIHCLLGQSLIFSSTYRCNGRLSTIPTDLRAYRNQSVNSSRSALATMSCH